MGALKDVPVGPSGPTKYRVTAPTSVFGVAPGETFTREIPEGQEARLLASGAIEKVGGQPAAPKAPEAETNQPSATPTPEKE